MQGKIKFYNDKKGFGKIEQDGIEYFFYTSDIKNIPEKIYKNDKIISFDIVSKPKGPIAKNILFEEKIVCPVCNWKNKTDNINCSNSNCGFTLKYAKGLHTDISDENLSRYKKELENAKLDYVKINNTTDAKNKIKLTPKILEQDMFETIEEYNKRIKNLGLVEVGNVELDCYDIENELFYFKTKLNTNLKKMSFNIDIDNFGFAIELPRTAAKELFEHTDKYKILATFSYINNLIKIDELKFYKYTFIKLETDNDELNINLGISYHSDTQSSAKKSLKYLFSLGLNNNPRALISIAQCYTCLQDHNEALMWYKKALKLNSKFSYYHIAITYQYLEYYNESIVWFKKALELTTSINYYPKWIYHNMSYSYTYLGNRTEAIVCLKKSIEVLPNYTIAYWDLAYDYAELEDYAESIRWWKKYISLVPKDDDAYNRLGNAYDSVNDYFNAKKFYSKALEINPNHEYARDSLYNLETNH